MSWQLRALPLQGTRVPSTHGFTIAYSCKPRGSTSLWLLQMLKCTCIHPQTLTFKYFFSGVKVHPFNPSAQEAEAGESLTLKPAWSTYRVVPGQLGLHHEILSPKLQFLNYLKFCFILVQSFVVKDVILHDWKPLTN